MVNLDARHLKFRHHNMGMATNKRKLLEKNIDSLEMETMINNNVVKLILPHIIHKLHLCVSIILLIHHVLNPTRISGRPVLKVVLLILHI